MQPGGDCMLVAVTAGIILQLLLNNRPACGKPRVSAASATSVLSAAPRHTPAA
jgi:hypothetical protein